MLKTVCPANGVVGGTAYANVMHHVVDELPDEARPATVEYFGAR